MRDTPPVGSKTGGHKPRSLRIRQSWFESVQY